MIHIQENEEEALACPHCYETVDMHHYVVDERQGGEDKDGVLTLIEGLKVTQKQVPEKQMPGRRNTVAIRFLCWNCQHESTLQLKQHKGACLLSWHGIKARQPELEDQPEPEEPPCDPPTDAD
jgi:hypothetical protein